MPSESELTYYRLVDACKEILPDMPTGLPTGYGPAGESMDTIMRRYRIREWHQAVLDAIRDAGIFLSAVYSTVGDGLHVASCPACSWHSNPERFRGHAQVDFWRHVEDAHPRVDTRDRDEGGSDE